MFTAPFVFGIAAVHTAAGYIISRFLIGWALAGFVTCQFWTSIMFSPNVVGFANALAGGWGNAGQALYILLDVHTVCSTLHLAQLECSTALVSQFSNNGLPVCCAVLAAMIRHCHYSESCTECFSLLVTSVLFCRWWSNTDRHALPG